MRPSSRSLKKLPDQLALVQHHHRQASVELWTMDEHRIGLKPILRRVWAPKGATVKAPVAQRYAWMYVFAFVHPQSGQTSWLLLPTVNVEVFSLAAFRFCRGSGSRARPTHRVGTGSCWLAQQCSTHTAGGDPPGVLASVFPRGATCRAPLATFERAVGQSGLLLSRRAGRGPGRTLPLAASSP